MRAVPMLVVSMLPLTSGARPEFTREAVIPFQRDVPGLLAPGMIVTIYGNNLGPEPWCNERIPERGPYPEEACGVHVRVGGIPAQLMYVGAQQLNIKIPENAPKDGSAPIQVCVNAVCSSPVDMRFSTHTAFIRVQGTAYVHMPIWVEVQQPEPYPDMYYPCMFWPWDLGSIRFEVRRDGHHLRVPGVPIDTHTHGGLGQGGCPLAFREAPFRSRLPLHLVQQFDEPGVYSVRFTAWRYTPEHRPKIFSQSKWTDIVVEPFSILERKAWLRFEEQEAESATPAKLIADIIPSILAFRDENAAAVLKQLTKHPNTSVAEFARKSLPQFGGGADNLLWILWPNQTPQACPQWVTCRIPPGPAGLLENQE